MKNTRLCLGQKGKDQKNSGLFLIYASNERKFTFAGDFGDYCETIKTGKMSFLSFIKIKSKFRVCLEM